MNYLDYIKSLVENEEDTACIEVHINGRTKNVSVKKRVTEQQLEKDFKLPKA